MSNTNPSSNDSAEPSNVHAFRDDIAEDPMLFTSARFSSNSEDFMLGLSTSSTFNPISLSLPPSTSLSMAELGILSPPLPTYAADGAGLNASEQEHGMTGMPSTVQQMGSGPTVSVFGVPPNLPTSMPFLNASTGVEYSADSGGIVDPSFSDMIMSPSPTPMALGVGEVEGFFGGKEIAAEMLGNPALAYPTMANEILLDTSPASAASSALLSVPPMETPELASTSALGPSSELLAATFSDPAISAAALQNWMTVMGMAGVDFASNPAFFNPHGADSADGRFASFPRTRTKTRTPVVGAVGGAMDPMMFAMPSKVPLSPIGSPMAMSPDMDKDLLVESRMPMSPLALSTGLTPNYPGLTHTQSLETLRSPSVGILPTASIPSPWATPQPTSSTEEFAEAAAKLVASLTPEQRMSLAAMASAGATAIGSNTGKVQPTVSLDQLMALQSMTNGAFPAPAAEAARSRTNDSMMLGSPPPVTKTVAPSDVEKKKGGGTSGDERAKGKEDGKGSRSKARTKQGLLGIMKMASTGSLSTQSSEKEKRPIAIPSSSSLSNVKNGAAASGEGSSNDAPGLQRFPFLAAKAAAALEAAVRKAKVATGKSGSGHSGAANAQKPVTHRFYQPKGQQAPATSSPTLTRTGSARGILGLGPKDAASQAKKDKGDEEDGGNRRPRGRTLELAREELRSTDEVKSRGVDDTPSDVRSPAIEEEGNALDLLYQHVKKVANTAGPSGALNGDGNGGARRDGALEEEDDGVFSLDGMEDGFPSTTAALLKPAVIQDASVLMPPPAQPPASTAAPALSVVANAVNTPAPPEITSGEPMITPTTDKFSYRLSGATKDDDEDSPEDISEGDEEEDELDYDAMSVSSIVTSAMGTDQMSEWQMAIPTDPNGLQSRMTTSSSASSFVGAGVKRRVSKLSRVSDASGHSRDRYYGAVRKMRPSSNYSNANRMSGVEGAGAEPSNEDIKRLSELQLEPAETSPTNSESPTNGAPGNRPPSQDVTQKCYVFVNETNGFEVPTVPPTAPPRRESITKSPFLSMSQKIELNAETSTGEETKGAETTTGDVAGSAEKAMTTPSPSVSRSVTPEAGSVDPFGRLGTSNLSRASRPPNTVGIIGGFASSAMAVTAAAANSSNAISLPALPPTAKPISAEPIAGSHQMPGCLHMRVVGTLVCEDAVGSDPRTGVVVKEGGGELPLSPPSSQGDAAKTDVDKVVENVKDEPDVEPKPEADVAVTGAVVGMDVSQYSVFACEILFGYGEP
ncbi:hypothetical protein HDU97_000279 [Phlyctochytrium planicorne]|nr:hypothetical protein HDU97_000279 [Phlyctochytrium planicorne]